MFKGPVMFAILAMASSVLLGQDVFPRDGNEALAMRLHDWYVQSQAKLTNYKNELPRAERNAKQFVNLPGDHEDLDKLNQIKAEIEREQVWSNKIRSYWEKNRAVPPAPARSFSGRYGPLGSSSEKSTNPKYDKIEFAIRSFPFDVSQPDSGNNNQPTEPSASTFSGTWSGTYNNSRNEPGSQTTSLVETNGKVEGTDDGMKILDGRRSGNTMTWRLELGGGFAKGGTTWNMTVQIRDNGNTLVESYTGRDHRTDKNDGGTYTGVATLHRK